jgi:hypothetical protein
MSVPKSIFDLNMELREAAQRGDIGAIRTARADGATCLDRALVWACSADQPLAVAYLADCGARVEAILEDRPDDADEDPTGDSAPVPTLERAPNEPGDDRDNWRAHVAFSGYREVLDTLLARGLDLREHDYPSQYAFESAARAGHAEIALKLLRAGAWCEGEPFVSGGESQALTWAAREGCPELVEALAREGAPLDADAIRRARSRLFFQSRATQHARVRALLRERGVAPTTRETIQWIARLPVKIAFYAAATPFVILFATFVGLLLAARWLLVAAWRAMTGRPGSGDAELTGNSR